MSVPFVGSRLANLRQKRQSQAQKLSPQKQVQNKPLTLPEQQDISYKPSVSFHGSRTATRFLKGRIDRNSNAANNGQAVTSNDTNMNKENNASSKSSLQINQPTTGQLKLVLKDSPLMEKKRPQMNNPSQPPQKRILIQKKQTPEQGKSKKPSIKTPEQETQKTTTISNIEEKVIPSLGNDKEVIKQQEIQDSKDILQNENQLVECPQGCGRKFNRKALEKHAKACKLVFMSKRKEFNSQAKRLTSKQQAAIIKQNKLQEKKVQLGKTKAKGFDKTSDNWKNASQDFRSAIKAIKKQGQEEGEEMKMVNCQYCEKVFAQVLLGKHLDNCVKKKEKQLKQKKKSTKKK